MGKKVDLNARRQNNNNVKRNNHSFIQYNNVRNSNQHVENNPVEEQETSTGFNANIGFKRKTELQSC